MPEEIIQQVNDSEKTNEAGFEAHLGSFSGPLDLLCHLVESRELNAVELNLTDLVSQYIDFLVKVRKATLNELAEFFTFASRIILRKVRSLFSDQEEEPQQEDFDLIDTDDTISEDDLRAMIARYRPYRSAAKWLAESKEKRERYFLRVIDEEENYYFDIGDIETLASKWWEILALYDERTRAAEYDAETEIWDEIPDAVPEERQIEDRMDELLALVRGKRLKLADLLADRSSKTLIVTLLAMLELSRLGLIHIIQPETLGSVELAAD
ncbi:MAG: segregation/condensation protein A [Synergistes sp.]|nr:segregation/condensation protein A [Synergistes sp.]